MAPAPRLSLRRRSERSPPYAERRGRKSRSPDGARHASCSRADDWSDRAPRRAVPTHSPPRAALARRPSCSSSPTEARAVCPLCGKEFSATRIRDLHLPICKKKLQGVCSAYPARRWPESNATGRMPLNSLPQSLGCRFRVQKAPMSDTSLNTLLTVEWRWPVRCPAAERMPLNPSP